MKSFVEINNNAQTFHTDSGHGNVCLYGKVAVHVDRSH